MFLPGYVIFYTTDPTVTDWVMEKVMGDRLTFTVHGLTPSTQYFYKMHARNVKGFGPFSSVGNFTTLPSKKELLFLHAIIVTYNLLVSVVYSVIHFSL